MNIYENLGIRPLINARSFSTKAGGCALPREVLEAMCQAAECCVRMDELQSAASDVISQATGAEAGIVTSGAAAALTLGAAACLAGLDVNRMNRLPDTNGMPDEFIVHRAHRNDYDHAVRASGTALVKHEIHAVAIGGAHGEGVIEVATLVVSLALMRSEQSGVHPQR